MKKQYTTPAPKRCGECGSFNVERTMETLVVCKDCGNEMTGADHFKVMESLKKSAEDLKAGRLKKIPEEWLKDPKRKLPT